MSGVDDELFVGLEFEFGTGLVFGDFVGGLRFVGAGEDVNFGGGCVKLDEALFDLVGETEDGDCGLAAT